MIDRARDLDEGRLDMALGCFVRDRAVAVGGCAKVLVDEFLADDEAKAKAHNGCRCAKCMKERTNAKR